LWDTCIDRKDSPASPVSSPSQVLYIVVRSDLPHGVQVAQTAHAASEASGHPQTIVVALQVPDETTLRRVAEALGEHSLTHQLVMEDAGPFAGQAMAIGIRPSTDRKAIGKVTSALPLVR
jgi:peptidyl-tRNA hydrolase